jgi:hypothetical protein
MLSPPLLFGNYVIRVGDDAEQMSAGRAYENAGVEHVVLALNSGDVNRITEVMEIIARDVIPQFR